MNGPSPSDLAAVVQRQLDAYNRKDLAAWLSTYAATAVQRDLASGQILASGHAAIGERMRLRFAEPDLHARLIQRVVMGDWVIDHEEVTRNLPEGRAGVPLVCAYQVRDGLIQTASFHAGDARPVADQA